MSWRRSPLPPDWPQRQRRVLERDDHRCRIRGPNCIDRATEVDHIGDRDDHDDDNLRAACTPCHRSRTGRQARAARRIEPTRRPPEPHPGLIV